jgi:hypothetical protein
VFRIPTFAQVKPLLEKTGYTFREGVYCRPKGDPLKYPNAEEGNDYFATESAFRDFLCRTGIDCNGRGLTREDKKHIVTWIRCNVIKSRKDENMLPAHDLTNKDASRLLIDLNFRRNYLGFQLPGTKWREPKLGVNYFLGNSDIWVNLARHGLPGNCRFERISRSYLLALEQFIATFESEDLDLFCSRKKEAKQKSDLCVIWRNKWSSRQLSV